MIVAAVTGGIALAACCAWAAWPIPVAAASQGLPSLVPPPTALPPETPSLDVAAFDVVLWPSRAVLEDSVAAVAPGPQSPAAPGDGFALIGITTQRGVSRAILYDERADVLLVVQPGDRVGRHSIGRVTHRAVEFSDGRRTRWLSLDPQAGASS